MIDRLQRGYAARVVAEGGTALLLPDAHEKALVYGLFALGMLAVDLVDVRANTENILAKTVREATSGVGRILLGACLDVRPNKRELIAELDARVSQRAVHINQELFPFPSNERLSNAVQTAMQAEMITLQTIQHRTFTGREALTHDGLYRSQRVPFKLAMGHTKQLNLEFGPAYQHVVLPTGGLGIALTPTAATLSEHQGLQLVHEFPMKPGKPLLSAEPAIGCPATLIEDFIRNVHEITADVTLQNDLIRLSDS